MILTSEPERGAATAARDETEIDRPKIRRQRQNPVGALAARPRFVQAAAGCCAGPETRTPGNPTFDSLLDLDSRTRLFELLLELRRFVLVHAFLDRLRRAFDQVLGLLEAEAGDRAHLLDDIDLLVTRAGQDDGEFRLLGR